MMILLYRPVLTLMERTLSYCLFADAIFWRTFFPLCTFFETRTDSSCRSQHLFVQVKGGLQDVILFATLLSYPLSCVKLIIIRVSIYVFWYSFDDMVDAHLRQVSISFVQPGLW